MKKTIASVILTALATMILCVCLTACSSNIAGTYKFYSMKGDMGGVSIDVKVGDKLMGMITLTEDYMVLTINEDNTATMKTGETTMNGKWSKEDGKYYLEFDGEKQEIQISGNKLTMSQDGTELVLKKA